MCVIIEIFSKLGFRESTGRWKKIKTKTVAGVIFDFQSTKNDNFVKDHPMTSLVSIIFAISKKRKFLNNNQIVTHLKENLVCILFR
jgi:hypothetical protein